MRFLTLFIILFTSLGYGYVGVGNNGLYENFGLLSIVDSQSVNLYNQIGLFTDISHAQKGTNLNLRIFNNGLDFDGYKYSDNSLPIISYGLHKEFSDIFFSIQRDNEKIKSDSILSSATVYNYNFIFSIGNPEYRFGMNIGADIGSGEFNGENGESYKRSVIGGLNVGLGMSITPNHNLSFNLELVERAAGDSITKEINDKIVTDGSILLNGVPDIKFGAEFINKNVSQIAYFKWQQNHRIANSNFYNTSAGGYLKIKFGMPKELSTITDFGYIGLFNIKEISKNDNLPINFSLLFNKKNSSVELYQPTDDNNFPTQQGDLKENFDYTLSVSKFGAGINYLHNYFSVSMGYQSNPVTLKFGSAYNNKSTFENDIISKSGDADGYSLPNNSWFDEGIKDIDDNEMEFNFFANLNIFRFINNKDYKPTFVIGYKYQKILLASSFNNGTFIEYNKPINFNNGELDFGLPYSTFNSDLNYIPIGQYNGVTDRIFALPLYVNSLLFSINSTITESIELEILYSMNYFKISDNNDKKFNGNDLLFNFKYLF